MKLPSLFFTLVAVLCSTPCAFALRFEQIGPDKDRGRATQAQPDWPEGMVEIARHGSRVYWTGGAGAESYYFKSTNEEIAELIKLYAECRLRDHQVFIKSATTQGEVKNFAGDRVDYNVLYYCLEGRGLADTRKHGGPQTYEPTLTISVDPKADLAPLKQLAIPDHVVLQSEVADWPASRATLPERKLWHAAVHFKDGTPASDPRLWTTITLWKKGQQHGFPVGEVDREGIFRGAFSSAEIADLKAGRSWLTLTVGNKTIAPRGDHPLLSAERLVLNPAQAVPLRIAKPESYYGRLLFQDGSPAILDRKVWADAEITVSFPFGGLARVDREGYFKLFFTAEQIEKVKLRADKNVYVPDFVRPRHAEALHTYPAARLSQDRAKAGELRIPRPGPPDKKKDA